MKNTRKSSLEVLSLHQNFQLIHLILVYAPIAKEIRRYFLCSSFPLVFLLFLSLYFCVLILTTFLSFFFLKAKHEKKRKDYTSAVLPNLVQLEKNEYVLFYNIGLSIIDYSFTFHKKECSQKKKTRKKKLDTICTIIVKKKNLFVIIVVYMAYIRLYFLFD